MKLKALCVGVLTLCLMQISAAVYAEPLSQQDYDQKIQHYTDVINASKAVLDDLASKADADSKSQSFCQRIDAYQQIAQLSKDNLSLQMASIMLMASQNFLDRQQKSLSKSGMTAGAMCKGLDSKE